MRAAQGGADFLNAMSAAETAHLLIVEHALAEVKTHLLEIKTMLSRTGAAPVESLSVTAEEARVMLGFASGRAFRRYCKGAGLVPYRRGWYRREDVRASAQKAALLRAKRRKMEAAP